MLRLNLWSYPVLFCCTGPMGATSTRSSLRPLNFRGAHLADLGLIMPRERVRTSLATTTRATMQKAARRRPFVQIAKFALADRRSVRAGQYHRLAGFDDMGGLAVVDIAAGRDAEGGHRDTSDQRHHHDLQVGRTISGVKGVIHLSLPASLGVSWAPFVGQDEYAPTVSDWFRGVGEMVSWLEMNDFAGKLAGKGAFAESAPGRDGRLGEKQ